MSAAMTAQLVTDALVMAIWRRGKPDALLHPLHGSVVPHVAGSAHRADDAVVGHQPLELLAGVLGGFKRSSQRVVCLHTVLERIPLTFEHSPRGERSFGILVG